MKSCATREGHRVLSVRGLVRDERADLLDLLETRRCAAAGSVSVAGPPA